MSWISAAHVALILGVARSTAATGLALLEAGRPWRGVRLPQECVTRAHRPGARADGALMILVSAIPTGWIRHPELLAEFAGGASPSTALVPYAAPQPPAIVAQASRVP